MTYFFEKSLISLNWNPFPKKNTFLDGKITQYEAQKFNFFEDKKAEPKNNRVTKKKGSKIKRNHF